MSTVTESGFRARVVVVFVVLIVFSMTIGLGLVPSVSGAAATYTSSDIQTASIENVTLEGEGYDESQYDIIANHPGPAFVWQDRELYLNATIASNEEGGTFYLCGRAYSEESDSSVSFDCERFTMSEHNTESITLSLDSWPDNATGNHTIVLELDKSGIGENVTLHESTLGVSVIQRDGDLTGDGLKNEEEFEHGTDITRPDTSGNGLTDWEEVKKYGTDPLKLDTTGDRIPDATLVRLGLDPTVPYLLHRYVAGGLLAFLATVGGIVLLVRKRVNIGLSTERSGTNATVESEINDHHENGGSPNTDPQGELTESMLTNEEVVYRELQRNEGRMRQGQIVDSTDWSKAKVSRVLSQLEEEGVIERIRIGRENIVDLAVDDPESEDLLNEQG